MPFLTADITDERDGLATFAGQQMRQVATTLQDLDAEQLASTPSASSFAPGTLARHVIGVAEGFAQQILDATARSAGSGRDGGSGGGGADGASGDAAGHGGFGGSGSGGSGSGGSADALRGDDTATLHEGDTARSLIEEIETAADRLAAAIRDGDLDAPIPVPEAPWFSGQEQWTVRWVALHCIEEVARHAGHADIIRESIDGKGAYEVNAQADGEPWPPPGW